MMNIQIGIQCIDKVEEIVIENINSELDDILKVLKVDVYVKIKDVILNCNNIIYIKTLHNETL